MRVCHRIRRCSWVVLAMFASIATAQPYSIGRYLFDSGGGRSSGGSFSLSGTLGQPIVGSMSGGTFALIGGFWTGDGDITVPVLIYGLEGSRLGESVLLHWSSGGGDGQLEILRATRGETPQRIASVDVAAGRYRDEGAPTVETEYWITSADCVGCRFGPVSVKSATNLGPWLASAVPNPFNPATTLRFAVPRRTQAELALFDLRGRRVRTLHRGPRDAGTHVLVWNGRDDAGVSVASGVYVARLRVGRRLFETKLTLVR